MTDGLRAALTGIITVRHAGERQQGDGRWMPCLCAAHEAAREALRAADSARPAETDIEALLMAVELVDNSWQWTEVNHVEWSDELAERLADLRRAYSQYTEAEHVAGAAADTGGTIGMSGERTYDDIARDAQASVDRVRALREEWAGDSLDAAWAAPDRLPGLVQAWELQPGDTHEPEKGYRGVAWWFSNQRGDSLHVSSNDVAVILDWLAARLREPREGA